MKELWTTMQPTRVSRFLVHTTPLLARPVGGGIIALGSVNLGLGDNIVNLSFRACRGYSDRLTPIPCSPHT